MACAYCFYKDEMKNRREADYGVMSKETAEAVLGHVFEALGPREPLSITFQGGEPTLAGLDFFRFFVQRTRQLNTHPVPVNFSLQTNGLLLDEKWAGFLKECSFLVGLSLDGTKDIHDQNRVTPDGKSTYQAVIRAADLLTSAEVPFNVLTVVTRPVARKIAGIYRDYAKHGFRYQQYIPCLDPFSSNQNSLLSAEDYEGFLTTLFDLWYRDLQEGRFVYIGDFIDWINMLRGHEAASCGKSGSCTAQLVVEADGRTYPCDFYVLDEYYLGNLASSPLPQIEEKRKSLRFIEDSVFLSEKCQSCWCRSLCRGGCRRYRTNGIKGSMKEEAPLNRFCRAYQGFFSYAGDRLMALAKNSL